MDIHHIIKEKRRALGLTQEQVAQKLGVTTPAVNKWEHGITLPDITLLAPLARLLQTDINTLLAFHPQLTREEVAQKLNELTQYGTDHTFPEVYQKATQELRQYPNCSMLLLHVAMLLDSFLLMDPQGADAYPQEVAAIQAMYETATQSDDLSLRSQALSMLISKHRQRKEYEKAQELLRELPDPNWVDKKQLEISLLLDQGKLEEGAKKTEQQLLTTANQVQTQLLTLLDIAWQEGRKEDAAAIAQTSEAMARALCLGEYGSRVAQFQLCCLEKDADKGAQIFLELWDALSTPWEITSPLYRHLPTKADAQGFSQLRTFLLRSLQTDDSMEFLRNHPKIQALLSPQ
jgi:transcriptional regulator with XRE-family HTH domain